MVDYKFKDVLKYMKQHPRVLIIRMPHVPIIDATGIQTMKGIYAECKKNHTKIILSELNSPQVLKELKEARILFAIGKGNVAATFEEALEKAKNI